VNQLRRTPQFGLQDIARDDCHMLILRGELDLAAADYLEAVVFCLFLDGIDEVTLNLSRLTFIDATGLRALLAVQALCEHEECRFSLTRPAGQVRRLFELTGVIRTLPIEGGQGSRSPRGRRIRPVPAMAPRNGAL
jgi:anti-anti-sigma factor